MSGGRPFVDISGQRFGRLTALEPAGKYFNAVTWLCQCECGRQTEARGFSLRAGAQRSCGCLGRGRKFVDISGQQFGRLTALEPAGKYRNGAIIWLCQCDCGTPTRVSGSVLRSGAQRSCGCLRKETSARVGRAARRHGHCVGGKSTPEYNSWRAMLARCYLPTHRYYWRYGGCGIRVCERWRVSFAAFLADMGPRPPGCTLDRLNNKRGYEPGSVRWATLSEQNKNRRRWAA
jgi:hypothetical protein